MLRLTPLSETDDEVVLRTEGWLEGPQVGVLAKEIAKWRQAGRNVVLDVQELKGVELAGLALLASWRGKGVEVRAGSRYIRELLARHGLADGQSRGCTAGPSAGAADEEKS